LLTFIQAQFVSSIGVFMCKCHRML